MKIVSWNLNSINARLNNLKEFIIEHNPDILLLQETKCTNENFPHLELEDFPYNIYIRGQKSYNGVAILSKYPAEEVIYEFPNNPIPLEARFIQIKITTPIGYLNLISIYIPNGGEAFSEKFQIKLKFYEAFIFYLESIKNLDEKIIVGGDFNVAPFDIDVYSTKALENSTCFTNIEKNKLRHLMNVGFVDLYRLLHPKLKEFTWWDYRGGGFEQNKGMRIDMILLSYNCVQDFSVSTIDYHARTKPAPSDHAPIIIY